MNIARTIVAAGFVALVLVACGSATKTTQPGHVRVFFCTTVAMTDCKADATRAQEIAVGRALRQNPHVLKAVYVSKSAALKKFTKMNTGIPTSELPANPLPDEWVVTVDSDQNSATVGKAICVKRYPGVEPCHPSNGALPGGVMWKSSLGGPLR